MGRFSEEMEKLACGIARERDSRLGTLRGLHDDVMRLRTGAREQVAKMSTNMTSRAAEQREKLRTFVAGLRADVARTLSAAGARMSRTRRDRERRRDDGLRRLRTTVAGMRQASRRFLREACRARTNANDAMADRLVGFVEDLRSRVGRLLGQSRTSVLEMRTDFERGAGEFRRSPSQGPGRTVSDSVRRAPSEEMGFGHLQLSERIMDALKSAGFMSVEGLFKRGRKGLMEIPGIGAASLKEIEKALKKYGFHLDE